MVDFKRNSASTALGRKTTDFGDAETFGDVVTNFEKLLTPKQRKSLA